MELVTRKQWGARPPRTVTSLRSTKGVKVHYVGSYVKSGLLKDHKLCAATVRQIQDGHMDGKGWNDVGYTALVCPHGHVFVGRGPNVLPAANGMNLNSGHYAVCGLVGNKGLTKPTVEMFNGIRDAVEWLRREGEAGHEIRGHRDGYATDCPGPYLYPWVQKGAPRIGDDDMASPEELFKIVWTTDKIKAPPDGPSGPTWRPESYLFNTYRDMAKSKEVAGWISGLQTQVAMLTEVVTTLVEKVEDPNAGK